MARQFVALRLRVLRNTMATSSTQSSALWLVIGSALGLFAALLGLLSFASAGNAGANDALLVTALLGSLLTAMWIVAPLLYGVDETLQPARFVLLPLTRWQLTTGLLAASLVGVPPWATLLATSGTVIAAAQHGPVPTLVAVVGVPVGLAVCLVGSRAITTAFARLLAARRVRDLAVFVGFLLAAGVWLAAVTISEKLTSTSFWEPWLPVVRVVSWTPLAAPWSAWWEAANGRGPAALAKLLVGVVTLLLLQWWWGRSLTSVMTGGATPVRSGSADRAGDAGDLVPHWLRRIVPTSEVGAVVGRMVRIWGRDTRFRIALITYLIIPVALGATWRSVSPEVIVAIGGCAMGLGMANTFGYDGPAYATHLLAGLSGRLDLRARIIANALLAVPIIVVVAVAVSLSRGDASAVVPAVATGLAGLGCTASLCGVHSAYSPYVAPPPEKPFSAPPEGAARSLVTVYGSLVGGFVLASPVLVLALSAPGTVWWPLLAVLIGVVWAVGAAELGAIVGGRVADRRGPEIVLAITPRR